MRKSYEFARLIDPALPEPDVFNGAAGTNAFKGPPKADQPGAPDPAPRPRPTLVTPVDIQRAENAYLINGQTYPRVTDILRAIPKQNWLAPWYAKQVVECLFHDKTIWEGMKADELRKYLKAAPIRARDAAGDRGQRVHVAIMRRLRGQPAYKEGDARLLTDEEVACVNQALHFVNVFGLKIKATEMTVWRTGEQPYAGTVDVWAERAGEQWLLDWKTSTDIYTEHDMQVAAYAHAMWAGYDGQRITWGRDNVRAGLVHVTPDGCTLVPIERTRELFETFRALWTVREWNRPSKPVGRGEPQRFALDEGSREMAIYVSEGENRNIPPHPEGQYSARCIDVVDYGEQEDTYNGRTRMRRRGVIRFYCGQEHTSEETGEVMPLWVDAWFTMSLHERANLRKFLEVWRGKPFTPEELKKFDLEALLGAPAYIQVHHKVGEISGRTRAEIASIMKLPKGAPIVPTLEDSPNPYVRVQDRKPEEDHDEHNEPAGIAAGEDDGLPF